MRVFSDTNIGLIRRTNQDTCKFGIVSDTCVWSVVCDGMGGVNGGNIASTLAADIIGEIIAAGLTETTPKEEIKDLCFHAINEANSAIFSRAVDEPSLRGMGTTVVLAVIKEGTLFLSHVGDSRAYLKSGNSVTQITTDHSYVQDLIQRGEITPEEAKTHPHRNIITRSVGVHSIIENDYQERCFLPGDVFVSCSDGLSNYFTEELLLEFLKKYEETELANELIQYALQMGGADNVTVSIIYNT